MSLKRLMKKALCAEDIQNALPNTNIWAYGQLNNIKNLNNLFGSDNTCILLYESKQDYGHWICLIQHPKGIVEVFDSYGIKPDNELNYINSYWKKKLGQNYPKLTQLLVKSKNKKFIYNQYRLQKMLDGINTCGRHCICRINFKDIPLDEYVIFLRTLGKPDEIVTLMTSDI